jgi:hypothetical protein
MPGERRTVAAFATWAVRAVVGLVILIEVSRRQQPS